MLTPRQKAVWEFIKKYWLTHGTSPTYLEIQRHFRFKSPNSVTNFLKALQKKGFIQLLPGQKRHIILTGLTSSAAKVPDEDYAISIPFLGAVSAGSGLNWSDQLKLAQVTENETSLGWMKLNWPGLKKKNLHFNLAWLEVQGFSLQDIHVLPGDWLLVEPVEQWQPDGRLYLISHSQWGLMAKFLCKNRPSKGPESQLTDLKSPVIRATSKDGRQDEDDGLQPLFQAESKSLTRTSDGQPSRVPASSDHRGTLCSKDFHQPIPEPPEPRPGLWVVSANPDYPPFWVAEDDIRVLARVVAHWRWFNLSQSMPKSGRF